MSDVLLLNADWFPLRAITWQKAIEHVFDGKAAIVEAVEGKYVRSPSLAYPWPSVVVLKRYSTVRGRIKFSGRNVQARDFYACSYCGRRPLLPDGRPDRSALTIDHVIPKAQAKEYQVYVRGLKRWIPQTCWLNCVCACRQCNVRKADRRPEQAGMQLRMRPREPTREDIARMSVARVKRIRPEWRPYLPSTWLTALGLVAVSDDIGTADAQ